MRGWDNAPLAETTKRSTLLIIAESVIGVADDDEPTELSFSFLTRPPYRPHYTNRWPYTRTRCAQVLRPKALSSLDSSAFSDTRPACKATAGVSCGTTNPRGGGACGESCVEGEGVRRALAARTPHPLEELKHRVPLASALARKQRGVVRDGVGLHARRRHLVEYRNLRNRVTRLALFAAPDVRPRRRAARTARRGCLPLSRAARAAFQEMRSGRAPVAAVAVAQSHLAVTSRPSLPPSERGGGTGAADLIEEEEGGLPVPRGAARADGGADGHLRRVS